MQLGTLMTENLEEKKEPLNNHEPQINRGFELLLRNRRKQRPKTFQVKLGKLIAIWNTEIVFHFHFYLDIRKK